MHSPVLRDLFRLGWPVFVAQIAVMANGVIDTIMAGRYGTLDLAAVGIGASVYATLFITLMGVLFAVTPLVAHLHGAGRHAEVGEEVRQSVWLSIGLACLSVTLLLFPDPVIALSRLEPDVEAKVRQYLASIAWGAPAALAFRVFAGFTTAISRPRVVMTLNLAGLALKVPLNVVFMYGAFGLPALGGPGAAVATSVVAWITCIAAWTYCARSAGYRPYGVFARWSWPRLRAQWQLVSFGVPIGATFFVDVTAFTFMALFIARLGPLASGAHQIAGNVAALAFMLPLAIGNATGVLVGQSLGAKAQARARHAGVVGIGVGLALGLVVCAALYLGRGAIVPLYTADEDVQRLAGRLLALVAIYHVFDAVQAVVVNVLRGYKRAAIPMIIYAVALWGIGLSGGYALGLTEVAMPVVGLRGPLGAPGFWIAAIGGMVLTALLMTAYFLRVSRHPERA